MVTEVERALGFDEPGQGDYEARLKRVEHILNQLLSDKAVGNVLKGPFRLPDGAQPSRSFQ